MEVATLGFEMNYDAAWIANPPRGAATQEFRRTLISAEPSDLAIQIGRETSMLEVRPYHGDAWIGAFENGPEGLHGIFATPNPDTICVVAKGQGFWVPTAEPRAFDIIQSFPIKQVLAVREQQRLIFVDYTRLAAYGPDGFNWVTDELSWDGLDITDTTATSILGKAWDAPSGQHVSFSVNIGTGESVGGSSIAKMRRKE